MLSTIEVEFVVIVLILLELGRCLPRPSPHPSSGSKAQAEYGYYNDVKVKDMIGNLILESLHPAWRFEVTNKITSLRKFTPQKSRYKTYLFQVFHVFHVFQDICPH